MTPARPEANADSVARTSISDGDPTYMNDVRLALEDDQAFRTLKQLPGIKGTVERVKPARGADYRATVLSQTPSLLNHLAKFQQNDAIGAPDTAPYPEGALSPTTWRYIKVLSDLQVLFGSLDGWNVVEIGAGYGGQCKIITDVYDVASYTIFDLEPVAKLARKYLVEVRSTAIDKLRLADFRRLAEEPPVTYDLVISNWALSECVKPIQERYVEHVLRHSKRGYITYNQIGELCGVDSYPTKDFLALLDFSTQIMPEHPAREGSDQLQNFVVHWSRELPKG